MSPLRHDWLLERNHIEWKSRLGVDSGFDSVVKASELSFFLLKPMSGPRKYVEKWIEMGMTFGRQQGRQDGRRSCPLRAIDFFRSLASLLRHHWLFSLIKQNGDEIYKLRNKYTHTQRERERERERESERQRGWVYVSVWVSGCVCVWVCVYVCVCVCVWRTERLDQYVRQYQVGTGAGSINWNAICQFNRKLRCWQRTLSRRIHTLGFEISVSRFHSWRFSMWFSHTITPIHSHQKQKRFFLFQFCFVMVE